jgi:hypothetical protein
MADPAARAVGLGCDVIELHAALNERPSVAGSCSSGITLELAPEASCPPIRCDDAGACGGSSCTPIPGQFHQTLTFNGTPTQVAITVSRGTVPEDESATSNVHLAGVPSTFKSRLYVPAVQAAFAVRSVRVALSEQPINVHE